MIVVRVLMVVTDLERGGTPHVVRDLSVRLRDDLGAEVDVVCLAPWGPVAGEIVQRGIRVFALGARGAWDLRALWQLIRMIDAGKYERVFSFLMHANVAAFVASIFCKESKYIQSIQTTQPYPRWHWWLQGLAAMGADRVTAVSPAAAQTLAERAGTPIERVGVIYNAIDPNDFERSPVPQGNVAPYPVGFIGRLDPVKRVPDLVLAVAMAGSGVHLHIFGDGPDRPRVERAIAEHGIGDRVTLHGFAPAGEALRQIGCLVLCSEAEGMGLVLIEAMAAGVPIVATDAPGIRNVVTADLDALMVPVGNHAAIARAIARIAGDAALRKCLIAAGNETVRSRFVWRAVLPMYKQLLMGL